VRTAPNCRRPGRTCFSELETSKGGSDIIDCLRRAHIDALSLDLLGISHHGTDLESRSRGLARARQAAASHEEESPEARRFGYGYIDTGSRWRAKKMGARRPGAATALPKVTGVIVTARVRLRAAAGCEAPPVRPAQRKFFRCLGVKRPVS